jgi:hypothetical protein
MAHTHSGRGREREGGRERQGEGGRERGREGGRERGQQHTLSVTHRLRSTQDPYRTQNTEKHSRDYSLLDCQYWGGGKAAARREGGLAATLL